LIRLFQNRLDEISTTQDPLIIGLCFVLFSERQNGRPAPQTADQSAADQLWPGTQTFPGFSIFLVLEDITSLDPPAHEMVQGPRDIQPRLSGHISLNNASNGSC
jgi:hypothetical protein